MGESRQLEFRYIRDLTYEYNADIGLSYSSPVRGVWNIVHIGTLVPGAHQIYVCPTSCLRGVVLTTAEMGAMDRLSTIAVSEENILEGDLEESILHGTEHIIKSLPERPHAIMIFTSCIHHFMAANYQRVYRLLRQEYPDIDFVDCYMDPIMRRTRPPVVSTWRQIYRLPGSHGVSRGYSPDAPQRRMGVQGASRAGAAQRRAETQEMPGTQGNRFSDAVKSAVQRPEESSRGKVRQVNLIGNCFLHDENCDLVRMMRSNNIDIMQLQTCGTYDDFLKMADSSVNFYFHNTAAAAAKDMKVRNGQEFLQMRPGYDYSEIREDLERAAALIRMESIDKNQCDDTLGSNARQNDQYINNKRYMSGPECEHRITTDPEVLSEEWFQAEEARTEEAVAHMGSLLGNCSISIDYTAVDRPLELALYLLNHGLNIESVFIDTFTESEEIFRRLQAAKPDLKIYPSLDARIRKMKRGHDGKVVAIGQKSAYFLDTDYFVNIVENDGMYGFSGIRHLCSLIVDAFRNPKPMKKLVQVKGLGCSCM